MINIREHIDIKYDNQKEFAEHLPKMLEKEFIMTGANFSKKNPDVLTVFYVRKTGQE